MPKFTFKKRPSYNLFNRILKAFNINNLNSAIVTYDESTITKLDKLRPELLKLYNNEKYVPKTWSIKRIALKLLRQILKTRNILLNSKVIKRNKTCMRIYYIGYLNDSFRGILRSRVDIELISPKLIINS